MLGRFPWRVRPSIKTKLLVVLALASLAVTSVITAYAYIEQSELALSRIEKQLAAAAHGAQKIIPRDYHHGTRGDLSIPEERQRVQKELSELVAKAKLWSAYAVMFDDGEFHVTAHSDPNRSLPEVYEMPPPALRQAADAGEPRFAPPYEGEHGALVSYFYPISIRGDDRRMILICVDMAASEFKSAILAGVAWRVAFAVILFLGSFGLQCVIVDQLVRPLAEFSRLSTGLTRSQFKFTEEQRRRIDSLATREDEIGGLASSLVFMESQLRRFICERARASAEQQKEETELAIARDMQLRMVPQELAPAPNHKDIDIFGVLEPAEAVGGDLYDFFMIDEHRLFFQIGDVSDKGIHAALFMAMTKVLLKAAILTLNSTISETMTRVNRFLVNDNASQMFVTVFAGILDLRTGHIDYTDAGHEVPLVLRVSGEVEELPKRAGLPLAVDGALPYVPQTLQLNHGDCLLLYTDGVREGMNANREQFSRTRMVECMRSVAAAAPPREIISTLLQRLREFVQEAPQSDDIAVLAIRYLGDESAAISVSARRASPKQDEPVISEDLIVHSRP